jgi:hypothetical protein
VWILIHENILKNLRSIGSITYREENHFPPGNATNASSVLKDVFMNKDSHLGMQCIGFTVLKQIFQVGEVLTSW